MATKRCPRCALGLPLGAFDRRTGDRPDGLQSWCRDCHRAASRARQARIRSTPEGQAANRASSLAAKHRLRSTPEGREADNRASREAQRSRRAGRRA